MDVIKAEEALDQATPYVVFVEKRWLLFFIFLWRIELCLWLFLCLKVLFPLLAFDINDSFQRMIISILHNNAKLLHMSIMEHLLEPNDIRMAKRRHDSSILKSSSHSTNTPITFHALRHRAFLIVNGCAGVIFDIMNLFCTRMSFSFSLLVIPEVDAFDSVLLLIKLPYSFVYLSIGSKPNELDVFEVLM